MIVKESKQTRYEGVELELIQAAMWNFEEAQQAWENKHPNNPMYIQEMIIEKYYPVEENEVYLNEAPKEEILVRLDVDVIGLKYILGIFIEENYIKDIFPFPQATYMVGHEEGEKEVEFKDLVSELEKTMEE
jgi:hypothetical protein